MTGKPKSGNGNGNHAPDLSSLCLSITEHAPLPMASVEGTTHIVRYGNPAFCRLLNKPMEQLVGKPLEELLPVKDQCLTLIERVVRSGKPESYTEQDPSKPHPVFWSYTIWPVMADKGLVGIMIQVTETAVVHDKTVAMNEALMLGSIRQHELTEAAENLNSQLRVEIVERKLAEKALHRAQAQLTDRAGQLEGLVTERTSELSATNSQLETFVYSIAHDLRAPLRAMQGLSSLLVEEAGAALSETGKDCADRIDKSAQFMDALLSDLLAFSRVSQQHVELASVNLKTVVESVLARLQKDIRVKHARVESSGPWPVVLAHEATLAQVLFNLASNALKFVASDVPPLLRLRAEELPPRQSIDPPLPSSPHSSTNPPIHSSVPPPGPSINPPIHSSLAPPPPVAWVRIWVEDNGPGIALGHQDQIFRLFTRLLGDKYAGTGIGLAIVQKGVERMGGRVGVESSPGHGSRFWFELKKPTQ
jgi:signal transduction histidine kinase